MPSVSQAQGGFFRVVRAMQRGEMPITDTPAGRAAKSISPRDAHEFAVTKDKGLPETVDKDKPAEKDKPEEKKSHCLALDFVLTSPLITKKANVEASIRSAEKAVRQVSEQRRKHYENQAKQMQQHNQMLQKQLATAQQQYQKAQMQLQSAGTQVDAATQAQQAMHAAPAVQPPYGAMIGAMQQQGQQG